MLYPQNILEEIRLHNDIVDVIGEYLPLKQKGSSYFGLCPFHHEGTPSFSVSPEKQLFYCFGCGAAGNVFSFIMQADGEDFPGAVKKLSQRANITLPELEASPALLEEERQKNTLYEVHKLAGRFYFDSLHREVGGQALAYLEQRRVAPQIQRKFGLGFAPQSKDQLFQYLTQKGYSAEMLLKSGLVLEDKNGMGYRDRFYQRLMFPIFDPQSRVVGFGGRVIGKGEPKYLNSPETIIFNKSKNLYGLNFARTAKTREFIIVEGYMDMISVFQAGFANVVAALGTSFNDSHAGVLKKYADDVILLYDSDEPGINAALRTIPVLIKRGFGVKVLQVPDGKDPDEYIKLNGKKEFNKLLLNAVSHIKFRINCVKKSYNLDNTDHKVKFTIEAAHILATLDNAVERDAYVTEVSFDAGIKKEAIESEIKKQQQTVESNFIKEAQNHRKKQYDNAPDQQNAIHRGLMEHQRIILNLCASDFAIYCELKKYMNPEDFISEVYQKLCAIIYEIYEQKNNLFPGDIISRFETIANQELASKVFTKQLEFESSLDKEKALNESVRIVKQESLDAKIASNHNIMQLNALMAEKRKLAGLYITISDG